MSNYKNKVQVKISIDLRIINENKIYVKIGYSGYGSGKDILLNI